MLKILNEGFGYSKTVNSKCKIIFTGVRPGEKIHEQMIGKEDVLNI